MRLYYCPRCGDRSLEILKTYCYCINCNYSPTVDGGSEEATNAMKEDLGSHFLYSLQELKEKVK